MPTAASLAEAIKKEFDVETELIKGGGGVFDVHVNGTQVWSRDQTGRFPEHAEVLDKIAAIGAAS
ncbi:MAG: SelT/SelW/SelH family protein [Planctomycetota bacterium]